MNFWGFSRHIGALALSVLAISITSCSVNSKHRLGVFGLTNPLPEFFIPGGTLMSSGSGGCLDQALPKVDVISFNDTIETANMEVISLAEEAESVHFYIGPANSGTSSDPNDLNCDELATFGTGLVENITGDMVYYSVTDFDSTTSFDLFLVVELSSGVYGVTDIMTITAPGHVDKYPLAVYRTAKNTAIFGQTMGKDGETYSFRKKNHSGSEELVKPDLVKRNSDGILVATGNPIEVPIEHFGHYEELKKLNVQQITYSNATDTIYVAMTAQFNDVENPASQFEHSQYVYINRYDMDLSLIASQRYMPQESIEADSGRRIFGLEIDDTGNAIVGVNTLKETGNSIGIFSVSADLSSGMNWEVSDASSTDQQMTSLAIINDCQLGGTECVVVAGRRDDLNGIVRSYSANTGSENLNFGNSGHILLGRDVKAIGAYEDELVVQYEKDSSNLEADDYALVQISKVGALLGSELTGEEFKNPKAILPDQDEVVVVTDRQISRINRNPASLSSIAWNRTYENGIWFLTGSRQGDSFTAAGTLYEPYINDAAMGDEVMETNSYLRILYQAWSDLMVEDYESNAVSLQLQLSNGAAALD